MKTDAPTLLHLYKAPTLFAQFPELIAAESTRHGGVSPAPYSSLNLGINTLDDLENITENRRRFLAELGATDDQFASAHQVHGTAVLVVTEPGRYDGYDALITNQPGLMVGVTVADCVPILIYDRANRAVGAIHAGWKGTLGRIVVTTLATMQKQYGTLPENCFAYIGTSIDECSFEVGPEVADQFSTEFKRSVQHSDRSFVDLKLANFKLLIQFGIPTSQIEVSPFSTVINNDTYFSHRAEKGQTGRMLVVIGTRP